MDAYRQLQQRTDARRLAFQNEHFVGVDFGALNAVNVRFHECTFQDCRFEEADLSYSHLTECDCAGLSFRNAVLRHANLLGTDFRGAVLAGADLSGAYLYAAILEEADLTDVVTDERTQYFSMRCPEQGGFIGYKKCFNERLVTLWIPPDAIRTSATKRSCRTDKAFVVSVTSFDGKKRYAEAHSFVDENFVYRTGETVVADPFETDRWVDSTTGIHFWMRKEEAFGYL